MKKWSLVLLVAVCLGIMPMPPIGVAAQTALAENNENRSLVFGDATLDGTIDMEDVTAAMRYVLKAGDLSEDAAVLCDVTEDGQVNMDDVSRIMRYVLKAETCLKHTWQAATFVSPKTCTVCKRTEGGVLTLSEGLEFAPNEDGTSYTVTGMGSCLDTTVVIPETYNEKKVTCIGYGAFRDCTELTDVVIPAGVTLIDNSAFYNCTALKNVVIPSGVTDIGIAAFNGCSNLTSIVIPAGVKSIGELAFSGCVKLINMTVSENNTAYYMQGNCLIEKKTHKLLKGMNSSVIPADVTAIGAGAFMGCGSLNGIVIPQGVTSIGELAFSGCDDLIGIVIPQGVSSIGMGTFLGCSSLASVIIPEGVKSIGECAFYGCTGLKSVTIPKSVTKIELGAFSGCHALTSVMIPASVTTMAQQVFMNCSALSDIYCEAKVQPAGWHSNWNDSAAAVHWSDSWKYVNGVPAVK
ncbi:MAG: hypothetical protein E7616_08650 [Ruminococcaceae bacterium]|nr:hypothetical protein [Oscillospiraceae bacterium]